MEQVKGVSYSLGEFLGPAYWRNGPEVQPAGQTELEYEKSLLVNKDNDLFHCVIYLAPGIYKLKLNSSEFLFTAKWSRSSISNSVYPFNRRLSLLSFAGGLESQF